LSAILTIGMLTLSRRLTWSDHSSLCSCTLSTVSR